MITLKKISKATGLPPHLLPKKKKIEFTQGLCGEKKKKNVGVSKKKRKKNVPFICLCGDA